MPQNCPRRRCNAILHHQLARLWCHNLSNMHIHDAFDIAAMLLLRVPDTPLLLSTRQIVFASWTARRSVHQCTWWWNQPVCDLAVFGWVFTSYTLVPMLACIHITTKQMLWLWSDQVSLLVLGSQKVKSNPLHSLSMWLLWICHETSTLVDWVCNVWPRQLLQVANWVSWLLPSIVKSGSIQVAQVQRHVLSTLERRGHIFTLTSLTHQDGASPDPEGCCWSDVLVGWVWSNQQLLLSHWYQDNPAARVPLSSTSNRICSSFNGLGNCSFIWGGEYDAIISVDKK